MTELHLSKPNSPSSPSKSSSNHGFSKIFSKLSFTKKSPNQIQRSNAKSLLSNNIKEQKEVDPHTLPEIHPKNDTIKPTVTPPISKPLKSDIVSTPTSISTIQTNSDIIESSNNDLTPVISISNLLTKSRSNLLSKSVGNSITKQLSNSLAGQPDIPNNTIETNFSQPLGKNNSLPKLTIDTSLNADDSTKLPIPEGNTVYHEFLDDLDSDSDSDSESNPEKEEKKLKAEENVSDYCPGGYHPTYIGEKYGDQNQYLIVRKLGWGHFSTVWLAWDSNFKRHVAIKIVKSSQNYTETAIDEIKILEVVKSKNQRHPGKKHIVQLLDSFTHTGPNGKHICMVFEVLGENMLNLLIRYKEVKAQRELEIKKASDVSTSQNPEDVSNLADLQILGESYGGLPIFLVKQISKQLLLALDYLHRECGIIHTDIKPENILVEINDVERLLQVLEFEKKNKKMQKQIEKRMKDCAHFENDPLPSTFNNQHNASVITSESSSTYNDSLPSNPNSISHNYHYNPVSFSSSASNAFSSPASITIPKGDSINDGINRNSGVSRKNSLPVRISKPLTSPVDTSSVDNFFRSFSFSRKRTTSVLSTTQSQQLQNSPQPLSTTSISNSLSFDVPQPPFGILEQDETADDAEDVINSKLTKVNSSDTTDDSTVFVDAKEGIVSVDNVQHTTLPSPLRKNHQKTTSLATIDTAETIPNRLSSSSNEGPVPFPNCRAHKAAQGVDEEDEEEADDDDDYYHNGEAPSFLDDFEEIISIKIADLGNACWYNNHYTPDIQTRQYRSPEVILGGPWGCSADLWSTGCVIFELITGDYLFDPKSSASEKYSRDDDHIAQMLELLNIWPDKHFLRKCRRRYEIFDRKEKALNRIRKFKIWKLEDVLQDEYKINEYLAYQIADFLYPMLKFEPSRRVDAGSMCNHPWVTNIVCDDEADRSQYDEINRPFGLCGEDIKGYSELW